MRKFLEITSIEDLLKNDTIESDKDIVLMNINAPSEQVIIDIKTSKNIIIENCNFRLLGLGESHCQNMTITNSQIEDLLFVKTTIYQDLSIYGENKPHSISYGIMNLKGLFHAPKQHAESFFYWHMSHGKIHVTE